MDDTTKPMPIAIVGINCRLPGANDVQGFWDVLSAPQTCIRQVPEARWDWKDMFGAPASGPNTSYSNVAGFIDHVDCFDYGFFRISPREAAAMDPMQRLFLQAAWGALEDGSFAPRSLFGKNVGVFVGVGHSEYASMMREAGCDADAYRATGMAMTLVANRVSYLLNLQGPSEVIDTACSSSLVAIHRAVEQLRQGHCDLAIAGGINLILSPELHIAFSQVGMLSTSGSCRPFDAQADGYIRGEGTVALILKPLAQAQLDGDYIHATIAASAESHGGRAHSLTAPNFSGQARVIANAWGSLGAAIQHLSYIETHGTGTPLGDPVEVAGIKEAWRTVSAHHPPSADQRIVLGTLKGRIGHLEAAAGVAGVLKVILALRYGIIPSSLGYAQPNPQLDLHGTPFELTAHPTPWGAGQKTRLAGVSSFGFGGVNAHVVLEQAIPAKEQRNHHPDANAVAAPAEIILLSASDKNGVLARAAQLLDYLYPGVQAEVMHAVLQAYTRRTDARASLPELNLPPDLDAGFTQLSLDEAMLQTLLHDIGTRLGQTISMEAVRDCLNLGDLAVAISAVLATVNNSASFLSEHLAARASLPRSCVQPTLRDIATSLSLGRDLMRERLVIVSRSLSELTQQLVHILSASETMTHALFARARRSDLQNSTQAAPLFPGHAIADELFTVAVSLADKEELAIALKQRYATGTHRRIPLPGMPFRLDKAWFVKPQNHADIKVNSGTTSSPSALPNTSGRSSWSATPVLSQWSGYLGAHIAVIPSLLPWPEEVLGANSDSWPIVPLASKSASQPASQPASESSSELHLRDLRWAPPSTHIDTLGCRYYTHSTSSPDSEDGMDSPQCIDQKIDRIDYFMRSKSGATSTLFRASLAALSDTGTPLGQFHGTDSAPSAGSMAATVILPAPDLSALLASTLPPWKHRLRIIRSHHAQGILDLMLQVEPTPQDDVELRTKWSILLIQALQLALKLASDQTPNHPQHQPRCLVLPYRAATLCMQSGITQLPERLCLQVDPHTRLISVWAWQDGRQVMHLSGLEVRQAPWIFSHLPRPAVLDSVLTAREMQS